MRALPRPTWLQIVVEDGRNQLESARRALHLFPHLCADLMEKLLRQFQSVALSKDLAVNLGVYMQLLLSQQLLA
jgi:hypothetical protein